MGYYFMRCGASCITKYTLKSCQTNIGYSHAIANVTLHVHTPYFLNERTMSDICLCTATSRFAQRGSVNGNLWDTNCTVIHTCHSNVLMADLYYIYFEMIVSISQWSKRLIPNFTPHPQNWHRGETKCHKNVRLCLTRSDSGGYPKPLGVYTIKGIKFWNRTRLFLCSKEQVSQKLHWVFFQGKQFRQQFSDVDIIVFDFPFWRRL